nr:MAG: rep protein [Cressdnaviricota sp.]
MLSSYIKNKAAYDLLTFDENEHYTLRCKGIWLWGDAKVGKSQWAHDFGKYVGSFYEKGPSKFWDGYEGQEVVIMEEVRSSALFDAGYINRWTDVYPCKGEIKGSTVWLKHRYFIITSNIDPREFCMRGNMFDPVLYEAVKRRFIIREIHKCDLPEDHPYIDFHPEDVFDNPWCTFEDVKRGSIEKEDVSSSRDAAEPLGSQAPDVSQSAAPIEPSSPPASKIAPSMDFQNPFPF